MKFKTHNDGKIDANGTSFLGYVTCNYNDLVKIFGEPLLAVAGDKIDAEWGIKFKDGTVATIYNWKNGKNYMGDKGIETSKITQWNIGGFNEKACERVTEVIKNRKK